MWCCIICEHCVLCDGRCKLPTLSLLQSVLIHAVHYVEKLPSTGVGMPVGQPVLALTNGPYVHLYVVRCMYTPIPTSIQYTYLHLYRHPYVLSLKPVSVFVPTPVDSNVSIQRQCAVCMAHNHCAALSIPLYIFHCTLSLATAVCVPLSLLSHYTSQPVQHPLPHLPIPHLPLYLHSYPLHTHHTHTLTTHVLHM